MTVTTRAIHANRRMMDVAHNITSHSARRVTELVDLLGQVRDAADETTSTADKVHTSGTTSPTERIAMRRYQANSTLEDLRDHLDDWCHTHDLLARFVDDGIAWCHKVLGTTPPPLTVVHLCDGKAKGYDGHQLPWLPASHAPGNGWHDATCRDIAGPLGLCERCQKRMNRWRVRNGLDPLGVQVAA